MSPTTEIPAKKRAVPKSNRHAKTGGQLKVKTRPVKPAKPATGSLWQIVPIPVERIEASPYQPRLSFDEGEMADLVASVRAKGVQQPIIVRTCKSDREALSNGHDGKQNGAIRPNIVRFELIAGERRLRACKEAGRRTVPAIVRDDLTDAECAELALLENIQRSNLSVIEEARGYKRLMLQFRMTDERIAKKVGKSVATIRDTMRLLQLPEAVQKLLAERKLTAAHGRELLQLAPFERLCELVAERVARDHLTALSLQATLLPNVAELKAQKLVVELDFRTKFDWQSECGTCPHKAYVRSGYASFCLKPDEWKKKQDAATLQQKEEAERIMEEARQSGSPITDLAQLTPGSFRNLSHGTPPAGCTPKCPCHSEVADPSDPTKRMPICLNPSRYSELVKEERQANEDARRQKYLTLWQDAKDVLRYESENGVLRRMVTLLALPVLRAEFCRYADAEQWESLTRTVGASVSVFVPWEELMDGEKAQHELYDLLKETEPEKLLLLSTCLLLAYEANQSVRFGGETPRLDFVLGRVAAHQPELEAASDSIEGS